MKISRIKTVLGMFLVATLMILLTQATWAAGANPSDVPSNHWAYKAVKMLIDKGYLQLYQDQTFQGDKPVDRYTLATVVAKILNEIAAGQVGTSREDVNVLHKLTNEFRDELVKLSTTNATFDAKMADLNKQDAVLKEDLTKTTAAVQSLSAEQVRLKNEQAQLQTEVKQMLSDIVYLKERVQKLEEQNKKQNNIMWLAVILGVLGIAR